MIQINNLSIARGSKPILTNAELTLFPGEKVGLIGHNGAGKSSFLSALLGELHNLLNEILGLDSHPAGGGLPVRQASTRDTLSS